MKEFRRITVLTVSMLLLSIPFISHAQGYDQWVMEKWNKDKEEVFKLAKEQDRFILLFVGRPTCPFCKNMSTWLCDPDSPYKVYVEENFSTWYSLLDDEDNYEEDVYDYIKVFYEERQEDKDSRRIPWLFLINPDQEGETIASISRPGDIEEALKAFLPIDLLSASDLSWYDDEAQVFELAKAQKKFILKLEGKGTSPNCQKVMQQLNEEPLKPLLEENYILWYDDYNADFLNYCGCYSKLYAGSDTEDEAENGILPYISVINPNDPDTFLEELWGLQDNETLEEILQAYMVSNEQILPYNKVFVAGNELLISNPATNEQITVYSLTGQSLTSFIKNDVTLRIDTSHFPKGVLIVRGSTGWSAKVLLK